MCPHNEVLKTGKSRKGELSRFYVRIIIQFYLQFVVYAYHLSLRLKILVAALITIAGYNDMCSGIANRFSRIVATHWGVTRQWECQSG